MERDLSSRRSSHTERDISSHRLRRDGAGRRGRRRADAAVVTCRGRACASRAPLTHRKRPGRFCASKSSLEAAASISPPYQAPSERSGRPRRRRRPSTAAAPRTAPHPERGYSADAKSVPRGISACPSRCCRDNGARATLCPRRNMDAGEPLPGVLAGLTLSPQSELDTEPEPELEPNPEPESDPDRDPEPGLRLPCPCP